VTGEHQINTNFRLSGALECPLSLADYIMRMVAKPQRTHY
jgi:hypothetical protein